MKRPESEEEDILPQQTYEPQAHPNREVFGQSHVLQKLTARHPLSRQRDHVTLLCFSIAT